jgi:hypothetical protein
LAKLLVYDKLKLLAGTALIVALMAPVLWHYHAFNRGAAPAHPQVGPATRPPALHFGETCP